MQIEGGVGVDEAKTFSADGEELLIQMIVSCSHSANFNLL